MRILSDETCADVESTSREVYRRMMAETATMPEPSCSPTPTASGKTRRFADFETIGAALDYAATGACGLNFFDARAANPRVESYADLAASARRDALRLIALGVSPGDRIALIAETSPEFARAFFAAIYAGALPVPLPLPTSFGGRDGYVDQIRNQLTSCDPVLAVSPSDLTKFVAEAAASMSVQVHGWDSFARLHAPAATLPDAGADDIAYLQYSSGSTRFPHGVEVTHRALLANLNGHAIGVDLKLTDRVISWLPFYHDMGLVGCLLSPVANQVSADYLATEDFARRPLSWLTLVTRNEGTTLSYSPSFGYDICTRRISSQTRTQDRFDLSRWRIAGNGADMIRPSVMEQFAETFAPAGFDPHAFLPSYGLAEATLAVTMTKPGSGIEVDEIDERLLAGTGAAANGAVAGEARTRRLVNCGYPLPHMEVEIRGTRGEVLADRQIGKVFTRGPSIMTGYFRDPEATAACLDDGWLDTGDMGYLKAGAVYIVGRAKDMIIVNGKNHWPQDIEWGVEQLPGFKSGDIAAFAITTPEGEESPAVLVQCRTSDPAERARLVDEIKAKIKAMTGMSCVVELVPPRTLPRTSSGKLSRSKARALYLSGEIQPLAVAA